MQNHSISTKLALALAATGLMASLYASPAAAINKKASSYQNMGGNCHAADPLDDVSGGQGSGWFSTGAGMLRTALSYRNINDNNTNTSDNIVIVCNFALNGWAKYVGTGNVRSIDMYARNTFTNRDVNMSCTITTGYATAPSNYTDTKTLLLKKTGVQSIYSWAGTSTNYLTGPVSVICNVPAGVELNDAEITYDVDVGS